MIVIFLEGLRYKFVGYHGNILINLCLFRLEKEILKVFRGKDQCLQSSFVNYEDTLNHQRNTECELFLD